MEERPVIRAEHLSCRYRVSDRYSVSAVNDISFAIGPGEVLGLVGESGCGKSTVARMLSGICRPTGGRVLYEEIPVTGRETDRGQRKKLQREIQLVFQDSGAALNPGMRIEKILREPVRLQRPGHTVEREALLKLLEETGLDETCLQKLPGNLSGGQRQRVAVARSLILKPRLLIADEPISSMDLSIQAQIVNLFRSLQGRWSFAMLFIAHDLSMVRFISHRVGVMLKGRLVELGPCGELFSNPLHPYTQSLLSAIHVPDPVYERQKKLLDYNRDQPLGEKMIQKTPGHFVLET